MTNAAGSHNSAKNARAPLEALNDLAMWRQVIDASGLVVDPHRASAGHDQTVRSPALQEALYAELLSTGD